MSVHVTTRLVTQDDAPALAELLARHREAMAPWEPIRDESYYTETGQKEVIREILDRHAQGQAQPCVILVDQDRQGRGVATVAVESMLRLAFADLGLHRVEAGTLLHNAASRRVLARNGFTEIGVAPRYLKIAGRWQDHLLHQRLAG